jgi:mannose-6-phosphate isomerase-like protein (cupin superfamily)
MWKATSIVLAVLLAASVAAQRAPTAATFLMAKEIDAVRNGTKGDTQMVVTDAGKYNVGIATIRRNSTGKPESGIVHAQITEIYYVTDGNGTLVTGGTVSGAQALASDSNIVKVLAGPTTMGGTIQNAASRKISKGDFAIIPPGVQHSFGAIDGSIEYLIIRVDADHVLPAGLVQELVTKAR